jgi:hypothetical protein
MSTSTSTITIIDACDVAAYRAWTSGRTSPSYMRGLPTWVWQSAYARRRHRPCPAVNG